MIYLPGEPPSACEEVIKALHDDATRWPELAENITILVRRLQRPPRAIAESYTPALVTIMVDELRQQLRARGSSTLG